MENLKNDIENLMENLKKNMENSHPKKYGHGLVTQPMKTENRKDKSRACRVCGNGHAIIRKYRLMICRQCFRSNAKEIGFSKSR